MMAAKILELLGSEEEFFTLSEATLTNRLNFKGHITDSEYRRELLKMAEEEVSFIRDNNIRTLYFTDPDYPQRLLECEDAPVMLFATGNANLNATHVLSVVGTRNATLYGVNFINKLIDELAERIDDLLIISGLAMGCDITAHKRAMERDVPTVGVVAHGLDIIYPAEHRNYAASMVRKGGAIVTDYPHGTRPHRGNFLARNRIIAGMSDGVMVAESAAERGGALHTAKLAMLYNREVFALPGRTSDHFSGGCNKLIKNNTAHLAESADDIISVLNWKARQPEGKQQQLAVELTENQQAIINYITHHGEARTNELTNALNIPVGQLMAHLVELEFNGLLMAMPGARYRLA
jgi:DNA processing protein